jgi:hypothetical protein
MKQPELPLNIEITNNSYLTALAEYNRYVTSQKEAVYLVKCNKTGEYKAWNYATRKGIESYKKSFTIIKSTDKLN